MSQRLRPPQHLSPAPPRDQISRQPIVRRPQRRRRFFVELLGQPGAVDDVGEKQGVKGGHVHGSTDDFGYNITENPVHVHDLQATILHLLGIDHTRLTFYHNGIRRRLTNVHGRVVSELLS